MERWNGGTVERWNGGSTRSPGVRVEQRPPLPPCTTTTRTPPRGRMHGARCTSSVRTGQPSRHRCSWCRRLPPPPRRRPWQLRPRLRSRRCWCSPGWRRLRGRMRWLVEREGLRQLVVPTLVAMNHVKGVTPAPPRPHSAGEIALWGSKTHTTHRTMRETPACMHDPGSGANVHGKRVGTPRGWATPPRVRSHHFFL